MSSEEERLKHSRRRKKNILSKIVNDVKGPFKIKTVDPRKGEYKREKMRINQYGSEEIDETDSGGIL